MDTVHGSPSAAETQIQDYSGFPSTMPKRKRSEPDVGETFKQWQTELFRALKLAKGHERQGQAKRIQTQPDKAERVKKEIIVLKTLDLHKTADTALKNSLLRIKAVAESPRLPAEIKAGVVKPEISEEQRFLLHNVTSALCNQKPVREVIDKALVAICGELGVSPPEKSKGKKTKPLATAGNHGARHQLKSEKTGCHEKAQRQRPEKHAGRDTAPKEVLGSSSASSSEIEEDEEDTKSALVGDAQDPMAITSEEEEEGESDDETTDVELDSEEDRVGDMQDDDGDGDGFPSTWPPRKKTAKKKGLRSDKATNSTFLPSLMSGYVAGSDEEASDIEDEIGLDARKNRRGQRARQAIWEKRYKAKAKHLQQGANEGAVWDPKRGAVVKDGTKPWGKGRFQHARGRGGPDHVESPLSSRSQPALKKVENTGPLHPSWEAAKKAKEKNQTAPFQGKKITFDS